MIEPDIFVVEQLVLHRMVKDEEGNYVEYLVQWEGDWPAAEKYSWEPEGNIIDAGLVGSYWRGLFNSIE